MRQEIAVNTGTLASDIEVLQITLGLVENDMDRMYEAVQNLNSMWDGPANSAFNQQFAQDHTDMIELCNTVQKIIDCMEYAKNEYNVCENEVSGIVNAINV